VEAELADQQAAEDAAPAENERNEDNNQPHRTDLGSTQLTENKGQLDPWAKRRNGGNAAGSVVRPGKG
jgi:hypothetical protein